MRLLFRMRWERQLLAMNREMSCKLGLLPTGESSYKSYDGQGNVASETDFNGNTTFYTYDEQNRLIRLLYPDQSDVIYFWCCCELCKYIDPTGTAVLTYDAVHRLSSFTNSLGKTVSYQYNGMGFVTRIYRSRWKLHFLCLQFRGPLHLDDHLGGLANHQHHV